MLLGTITNSFRVMLGDEKLSVLKRYFISSIIILIIVFMVFYSAKWLNNYIYISQSVLQFLRVFSVIPAVIGVYGMPGWEIQTWNGNEPAERLNKTISRILIGIGFIATLFMFALEEGIE
jgi:hypothetical protein